MKRIGLFCVVMLIMAGCGFAGRHSGEITPETNRVRLTAQGNTLEVAIADASEYFDARETIDDSVLRERYVARSKYGVVVELVNDNGAFSETMYRDMVENMDQDYLLHYDNYTGSIPDVMGSSVVYDPRRCGLWRYIFVRISENYFVSIYGHVELKDKPYTCRSWASPYTIDDEQKGLIQSFVEEYDKTINVIRLPGSS